MANDAAAAMPTFPLLHVEPAPPVRFALLHVILAFARPAMLPAFVGPYLRGIVGDYLGTTFCRFPERRGERCDEACRCEFVELFRGSHPTAGACFTSPPFILKLGGMQPPRGLLRQLHFDLILLGPALAHAADFCRAFTQGYLADRRNAFTLHSVLASGRGRTSLYYDGAARTIVGELCPDEWPLADIDIPASAASPEPLALNLATPVRFKLDKSYCSQPFSCKDLVRALLNRYRHLSAMELVYRGDLDQASRVYHARHSLPLLDHLDAAGIAIADARLSWEQNESFSIRQQQRLSLGGLLGDIVYSGDTAPLMPLLRWGEFFHIGEKTNYGLGEYQIV